MEKPIINISHPFEIILTKENGDFATGETITYEVRNTSTDALITSGSLTEQNEVYKFSYTFTTLEHFRVKYFTPTGFPNGLETGEVINSIPDQVWDENLGDHLDSATTGEALANADATADPFAVADAVWQYDESGIGRQLTEGTRDAEIDSILEDTNEIQGKLPDNNIMGSSDKTDKDDEIDAIKAKTDNLPVDPASETNVDANETKIDALQLDVTQVLSDIAGLNDLAIADIQTALTNQGYTITRASKLDNLDATISSRSSHSASDVTTDMDANSIDLDQILADIASLNDINIADVQTALTNQGYTITRATKLDNLDTTVSSRASEVNATSNTNSIIAEIDANEVKIDAIGTDITAHRNATEDRIKYILGLTQHNTRIENTVYNTDDTLASADIKLYPTALDAQNDTNLLKKYLMTATYDAEGKMLTYIVKEA